MSERFPKIQANFRRYRILLNGRKTAPQVLTTALTTGGHPTEYGSCRISHPHPRPYKKLTLEAKIKTNDQGWYELKLFWREIDERPVFRFESKGGGHWNPGDGQKLPARKIPNPHFHAVREDGSMWAYRTRLLDDPEQEQHALASYSFGLKHFCQELNIHAADGAEVVIQTVSHPLTLSTSNDPLEGVMF